MQAERDSDDGHGGELTEAEQGVVHLLLLGLPYAEIAAAREASPCTVANQVASAYRKIGARSRAELAARQYPVATLLSCDDCIERVLSELSRRERRVVYAAALGAANKEIGWDLGISASTVASHLVRALRKLGVTRRIELARVLYERAHVRAANCCTRPTLRPRAVWITPGRRGG